MLVVSLHGNFEEDLDMSSFVVSRKSFLVHRNNHISLSSKGGQTMQRILFHFLIPFSQFLE